MESRVQNKCCLFIIGCFGDPAELRGPKGAFGINISQYQTEMECAWKIQVGKHEVFDCHKSNAQSQNVSNIAFFLSSL